MRVLISDVALFCPQRLHGPDERQPRCCPPAHQATGTVHIWPKDRQREEGVGFGTGSAHGGAGWSWHAGAGAPGPPRRRTATARAGRLCWPGWTGQHFAGAQDSYREGTRLPPRGPSPSAVVQEHGCGNVLPPSRRKPVGGVTVSPCPSLRQAGQGETQRLPANHQPTHHP